jgi:hypothetical protein
VENGTKRRRNDAIWQCACILELRDAQLKVGLVSNRIPPPLSLPQGPRKRTNVARRTGFPGFRAEVAVHAVAAPDCTAQPEIIRSLLDIGQLNPVVAPRQEARTLVLSHARPRLSSLCYGLRQEQLLQQDNTRLLHPTSHNRISRPYGRAIPLGLAGCSTTRRADCYPEPEVPSVIFVSSICG